MYVAESPTFSCEEAVSSVVSTEDAVISPMTPYEADNCCVEIEEDSAINREDKEADVFVINAMVAMLVVVNEALVAVSVVLKDELSVTNLFEKDAEATTKFVRPVPTDALKAFTVELKEELLAVICVDRELESGAIDALRD